MVNKILNDARERLAKISEERSALDQEERELRAMVAAAEGASAAPSQPIVPCARLPRLPPLRIEPTIAPWMPDPIGPWRLITDHGGLCACPTCCPPVICGDGLLRIQAEMPQTIYVGDVHISPARSAASVIGLCGASICSTSSATEAAGN